MLTEVSRFKADNSLKEPYLVIRSYCNFFERMMLWWIIKEIF